MSAKEFEPGQKVGELVAAPDKVQLFRYSAATWNSHRIHYDQEYAAVEDHPGLLVHSHLHGALLTRCVTDLVDSLEQVKEIEYRVRRPAVAGTELTVSATVAEVSQSGDVSLDLEERDDSGNVCTVGRAIITI